jgi:hypothetical protein
LPFEGEGGERGGEQDAAVGSGASVERERHGKGSHVPLDRLQHVADDMSAVPARMCAEDTRSVGARACDVVPRAARAEPVRIEPRR